MARLPVDGSGRPGERFWGAFFGELAEAPVEVREAAARLVQALADAAQGDPGDVVWAGAELALRRGRRRWLRTVDANLPPDLPEELRAPIVVAAAELLPLELAEVDRRALELRPQRVRELLDGFGRPGGLRTVAGLAARLAAECGAFDVDSQQAARRAFRQVVRREGRGTAEYPCRAPDRVASK